MTIDTHTFALSVQEYTEHSQNNVAASHTIVREALRALGVTRVTADYDGCGDSGQFESLSVFRGDEAISQSIDDQLLEQVERLLYDLLEIRHGGWEINDGAFGEFTWDLTTDTLAQVHHSRFTDYESFEYDGFGDESMTGGI